MTTLPEKYIAKIESKKYAFEKVDWGGGIEVDEPVNAPSVSQAEAKGFNRALTEVQSLLPELIKEVTDGVFEAIDGVSEELGENDWPRLRYQVMGRLYSLKEPNIK